MHPAKTDSEWARWSRARSVSWNRAGAYCGLEVMRARRDVGAGCCSDDSLVSETARCGWLFRADRCLAAWMSVLESLEIGFDVVCARRTLGGKPAGWRAGFSDLDPRPVGVAHSSGAAPRADPVNPITSENVDRVDDVESRRGRSRFIRGKDEERERKATGGQHSQSQSRTGADNAASRWRWIVQPCSIGIIIEFDWSQDELH